MPHTEQGSHHVQASVSARYAMIFAQNCRAHFFHPIRTIFWIPLLFVEKTVWSLSCHNFRGPGKHYSLTFVPRPYPHTNTHCSFNCHHRKDHQLCMMYNIACAHGIHITEIRVGPVFQARAGTITNFFVMWPKGNKTCNTIVTTRSTSHNVMNQSIMFSARHVARLNLEIIIPSMDLPIDNITS